MHAALGKFSACTALRSRANGVNCVVGTGRCILSSGQCFAQRSKYSTSRQAAPPHQKLDTT
eukprot:14851583-Alexandrium_andersonii.AAC.1